jgi:hypothetical protein
MAAAAATESAAAGYAVGEHGGESDIAEATEGALDQAKAAAQTEERGLRITEGARAMSRLAEAATLERDGRVQSNPQRLTPLETASPLRSLLPVTELLSLSSSATVSDVKHDKLNAAPKSPLIPTTAADPFELRSEKLHERVFSGTRHTEEEEERLPVERNVHMLRAQVRP